MIRRSAMRRNLVSTAVLVLIGATLAGGIGAQQEEGVTITASRVPQAVVVKPKPGSIMTKISLSYGVSYQDLDLATPAGKDELSARVRQAAMDACDELDRQYPFAEPKGLRCVEAAVDSAKDQVHRAVTAASGASAK
jgi:UrcA family protein